MIKRFINWFERDPDTVGPIVAIIMAIFVIIGLPPVMYYISKWWSYWVP